MTNANCIRILSVDGHPLFREGVAAVINSQSDMTLAGTASNGTEGIKSFHALSPDVTFMDLRLRDLSGLDVMTAIRSEFADARVIVLTTVTSLGELGKARYGPAILTANHRIPTRGVFRPYAGAGVAYAIILKEHAGSILVLRQAKIIPMQLYNAELERSLASGFDAPNALLGFPVHFRGHSGRSVFGIWAPRVRPSAKPGLRSRRQA